MDINDNRILVVDDEPKIRDLFQQTFSKAGYNVQTAQSAEEALEILKTTPYWVLILDLNLPGTNGIELCRQVRKLYPMALPIAVTGYSTLFEMVDCLDAGFEDYFIKPAKLAELLDAVDHAFIKLRRWKKQ